MLIKGIIDEDFVNYKKPSMTIMFPNCKGFKCDRECGEPVCQNSALAAAANIEINRVQILQRYRNNDIASALVFQGLEPMDSFEDMYKLIFAIRVFTKDPIVIYTGYTEEEIQDKIEKLKAFSNIIIKFGRYIPNCEPHYDEILGVNLASPNQYAVKIS